MELRLLGAIQLRAGQQDIDLGPPRQRAVVAALAVDADTPISTDTLVSRVWGSSPPEQARSTLYVYLARLRTSLRAAGGPSLLTRNSGGYVFGLAPDLIDLHRYQALLARSREPEYPAAERAALIEQALRLWRGSPLAGVSGPWATGVRERLVRQRLDATARWAQLHLQLGNAELVVDPLSELAAKHPLVEPLAVLLMRALALVGRSAEALRHFAVIRQRLADELGLDPGAELQHTHRAILRGELEELEGPAPAGTAARAEVARVRPAQLPLDGYGFVGRTRELAHLDAALAEARAQVTATVVLTVVGPAGVGKTALAVHWAHRVADRFPDGQLFVDLKGFGPTGTPADPHETLRTFLDSLGVPARQIPPTPDGQVALYRSLLAGRRMLVVLDNARDADQVGPLLPGAPGCAVVVTSRDRLAGLVADVGARPLSLDVLTTQESRWLLRRRLGAARVDGEPEAVEEIAARCARLPLALTIVAARIAAHSDFTLRDVVEEMAASAGLDAFRADSSAIDVRAAFSWSYRTLTPAAARLFRLLGLSAGPDIDASAAARLADVPTSEAQARLAELTRVQLLAEPRPGRYQMHELLRAWAQELTDRMDGPADRQAARQRLLDHYLRTAACAARALNPYRTPMPADPGAGVSVWEKPDALDRDQALRWFAVEQRVLMAAVRMAAETGWDQHAWRIAYALREILDIRAEWHELVAVASTALAAARRGDDTAGQAHAHAALALGQFRLGRHQDAQRHLEVSIHLFASLRDLVGQATEYANLGIVFGVQGDWKAAVDHCEQAIALYQRAGERSRQGAALNTAGWYHTLLGNYPQALGYIHAARRLHQEHGYPRGEAHSLDTLAHVYLKLGSIPSAVTSYQRAIALFRSLGDRYYEAVTLDRLGDAYHVAGDDQAARDAWGRASAILKDLDHPDAARSRPSRPSDATGEPPNDA